MIKRTKILKTRYKYKGLCNQSKEIIHFFVPVQDTLPSRTSPTQVLYSYQKPSETSGLASNFT